MENKHNVPEHNDESNKDHYHDEHHFDASGQHDDVKENDFDFKNMVYLSKRNLIYRISASGMFLALACLGSLFDWLLERVFTLPIDDLILSIRYFDILVVSLSISVIGPIFASVIAFTVPWIHLLYDAEHGLWGTLIDSFGYVAVVWVLTIVYYMIFKNSYIHKDPNRKKDLIKRWVPMPIFVIVVVAFYVPLTLWIIYVSGGHDHDHDHAEIKLLNNIISYHEGHEETNWEAFKEKYLVYTFIIIGFETLRFSVCYSLFAVFEPQMKKINHRYR
ncbi:transmembrane protein [Spiroplasma chinense]|uniref:Transmembrane protein n=1 Tax=Spiroplasma chinense TaxID=216932 RepID=A0A5B9Y6B8_9MOLU|nr:hypothetical protein [Spiroplasma chinense]QEH61612.1 transmembrane protein [Spiroplasma chinense]